MNWKLWIPVGLVVVVALAFFGLNQTTAPTTENATLPTGGDTMVPDEQAALGTPASTPIQPTDDVGTTVDAILAQIAADDAALAAEEANIDIALSDAQALSDFGTAYSANEF